MRGVPGVTDLMIEPQVIIPQLRIELDRNQLSQYGLSVDEVNDYVQTAMNGAVVPKYWKACARSTCWYVCKTRP